MNTNLRCNDDLKNFKTDIMTTFLYTVYGSAVVLHHSNLAHIWMSVQNCWLCQSELRKGHTNRRVGIWVTTANVFNTPPTHGDNSYCQYDDCGPDWVAIARMKIIQKYICSLLLVCTFQLLVQNKYITMHTTVQFTDHYFCLCGYGGRINGHQ